METQLMEIVESGGEIETAG